MPDKYRNKYRISSARLPNWDYSRNAAYFVTICTQGREHYFGNIVATVETPDSGVSTTAPRSNIPGPFGSNVPANAQPTMQLSHIGEIAQKYWMEIPQHFPFVQLNAFVVMPNHVHGIIVIDRILDGYRDDAITVVETPNLGVSTTTDSGVSTTTNPASKKWKPGTLGVIINQYKRAVTIHARKTNPNFAWQSRFHDHVIRNDESFERICDYILCNPENWGKDKFNNP
ncbi:MAG: transposase [Draconibacterium sp.]